MSSGSVSLVEEGASAAAAISAMQRFERRPRLWSPSRDHGVVPPDGSGCPLGSGERSESVGPAATPAQAVMMVVERLPPGCGPAFVGTPAELAIHDATALSATPEPPDTDLSTS